MAPCRRDTGALRAIRGLRQNLSATGSAACCDSRYVQIQRLAAGVDHSQSQAIAVAPDTIAALLWRRQESSRDSMPISRAAPNGEINRVASLGKFTLARRERYFAS